MLTLRWYIGRELLKNLVMAAAVLTLIMTTFAIIEPMREQGLRPGQVMQLFWFTLPVMLSLTLPIAALFAATFVYGRFAIDNELTACRASGIPTVTLLEPALLLALVVSLTSLGLNSYVAPKLARLGERVGRSNLAGLLYQSLRAKSYFRIDENTMLHADQSDPDNDVLRGVLVVRRDARNRHLASYGVAAMARVEFETLDDDTFLTLSTENGLESTWGNGWMEDIRQVTLWRMRLPSLVRESPEFFDFRTLRAIVHDPQESIVVDYRLRNIHRKLDGFYLGEAIAAEINAGRTYDELIHRGDGPVHRYELSADHAEVLDSGTLVLGPPDPNNQQRTVVVDVYDAEDNLLRTYRATRGQLDVDHGTEMLPDTMAGGPVVRLRLLGVAMSRPGEDGDQLLRTDVELGPIVMPEDLRRAVAGIDLRTLYSADQQQFPQPVRKARADLQEFIQNTLLPKIRAEMHGRVAYSAGCFLLVALGGGLGLIFRGGQILSAFVISFAPGMVLVLMIITGKQMAVNPEVPETVGLAAIWSGVGVLAMAMVYVYGRALRR